MLVFLTFVALVVASIVTIGLTTLWYWTRRQVCTQIRREANGVSTLRAIDELDYEEPEIKPPEPRGPSLKRFAGVLSRDVRLKMGPCPIASPANRLVAWELLGKACIARDVRHCDRLRFMILACDMVFIPNSLDVAAAEVRDSYAVRDRLTQVRPTTTWWSRMLGVSVGLTYRKE